MRIHQEAQKYVDWTIFTKTTSMLSPSKQLFILKHWEGVAAMGRNMVRRGERNTDECPQCGAPDEHTEHILQCTNKDAKKVFDTAFADMESWLQKTTLQDITEAIRILIRDYRQGTETSEDDMVLQNEQIIQIMRKQRTIGLYPWMCGFMCKDWVGIQADHFEKNRIEEMPQKMDGTICRKINRHHLGVMES